MKALIFLPVYIFFSTKKESPLPQFCDHNYLSKYHHLCLPRFYVTPLVLNAKPFWHMAYSSDGIWFTLPCGIWSHRSHTKQFWRKSGRKHSFKMKRQKRKCIHWKTMEGEKRTYKIVYKVVKWSIAFLYDHQLQICLVSEIFQVNSFYSLNKFFAGEDVILVWNQVPPQSLYICNKVDFSKARLLVLHVSGNKNPEILVQHYGNVNNSPKVFPSCSFLRKLPTPDKIGRTDIMK